MPSSQKLVPPPTPVASQQSHNTAQNYTFNHTKTSHHTKPSWLIDLHRICNKFMGYLTRVSQQRKASTHLSPSHCVVYYHNGQLYFSQHGDDVNRAKQNGQWALSSPFCTGDTEQWLLTMRGDKRNRGRWGAKQDSSCSLVTGPSGESIQ